MDKLYLVAPSVEHEDAYDKMMVEWEESEGYIYPGAIRRRGMTYTLWLDMIEAYRRRETCPSHLLPSDTFFLLNEHSRILGAISIRHYLNEQLLKFGGHIGYGIRPSERRKGYATIMLKLSLDRCKNMGLHRVLITCDKSNIVSSKTILVSGGALENELTEDNGDIVQRYCIEV